MITNFKLEPPLLLFISIIFTIKNKIECWQVFLNDPNFDIDTIQTFAILTGKGRNVPPFEVRKINQLITLLTNFLFS